jgi:hypothetical protein
MSKKVNNNKIKDALQELSNSYDLAEETKSIKDINKFNELLDEFKANIGIQRAVNAMNSEGIEIYEEILRPLKVNSNLQKNVTFIPFKLENYKNQKLTESQINFIDSYYTKDNKKDACKGELSDFKETALKKSSGGIVCIEKNGSLETTLGYILWNDNDYFYNEETDEEESVFKIYLLCSRSNVGARLMNFAEEYLIKSDSTKNKFILDATKSSVGFYKKLGYSKVYPDSEVDIEVLMYKKI